MIYPLVGTEHMPFGWILVAAMTLSIPVTIYLAWRFTR